MPPQDAFSHDQAVKNLIKDYPVEALEFLAEDVVATHGPPVAVDFLDPAVAKDDTAEPGPGQAMDLAIRYTFGDGTGLLFVLVEHWSSATKLDLLRTARYYLDLCRRFPKDDILPIALVDDDRAHDLHPTVQRGAMGVPHFNFTTRIVQVPSLELERFRYTANRVALSFTPNMAGSFDRIEQVIHVLRSFHRLDDQMGVRKYFSLWVVEGRLERTEQALLKQRLEEIDMPEIMDWFKQEGKAEGMLEGIRHKALQDARKMLEHGIAWSVIIDITGIHPEDLAESKF